MSCWWEALWTNQSPDRDDQPNTFYADSPLDAALPAACLARGLQPPGRPSRTSSSPLVLIRGNDELLLECPVEKLIQRGRQFLLECGSVEARRVGADIAIG
jgi:hypothetical protein